MKNLVYTLFPILFTVSSFICLDSYDLGRPSIEKASALSLDIKINQPSATDKNDGSISFTVSGGEAPYTIQVISTFAPSQTYAGDRVQMKKLGAGRYTVFIQDAKKNVLQQVIELTPEQ